MSAATTGAASGDSVAPADIVMPVKLKFAQILVCWSKVLAISGVQFRPCVVGGRGLRSSSGRACSSRVLTYARRNPGFSLGGRSTVEDIARKVCGER